MADDVPSESLREFVNRLGDELGVELLVMDDFDDCIVGLVERFTDTFVLYDYERVIAKLVAGGLDHTEAKEHFHFNMNGGWYGSGTWGFLHRPTELMLPAVPEEPEPEGADEGAPEAE